MEGIICPPWDPDFASLLTPSVYNPNLPLIPVNPLSLCAGQHRAGQAKRQVYKATLIWLNTDSLPDTVPGELVSHSGAESQACPRPTSPRTNSGKTVTPDSSRIPISQLNHSLLACSGWQCQSLTTAHPSPLPLLLPQEDL